MRVFVALLIVFAQLAGPWLCCCGTERLAKHVRSPQPTPTKPAPKPDGCPHCKHEAPTEPTEPTAPPAPHAPERCPCGGAEVVAVPAPKPDLPTAGDGLLIPVCVPISTDVPLVSVVVADRAGLRELPHLTTSERLFAHHVLRC